jgi:hypothetical protein
MDAEEARVVDAVLRRLGLPGVVAPEDPEDPAGSWRVYDRADPETRTDTTAEALVSLAKAIRGDEPSERKGPTRGFIIPSEGD